jgi:hypothetical protein
MTTENDERERLLAEIVERAPSLGDLAGADLATLRWVKERMDAQAAAYAAAGFVDAAQGRPLTS